MASRLAHRIFVYGTLKKGQPNYFRLQDTAKFGQATFLGEAKLSKRYPMVIASKYNVPVLLDKEGDGKVSKEQYTILWLLLQKCAPPVQKDASEVKPFTDPTAKFG